MHWLTLFGLLCDVNWVLFFFFFLSTNTSCVSQDNRYNQILTYYSSNICEISTLNIVKTSSIFFLKPKKSESLSNTRKTWAGRRDNKTFFLTKMWYKVAPNFRTTIFTCPATSFQIEDQQLVFGSITSPQQTKNEEQKTWFAAFKDKWPQCSASVLTGSCFCFLFILALANI